MVDNHMTADALTKLFNDTLSGKQRFKALQGVKLYDDKLLSRYVRSGITMGFMRANLPALLDELLKEKKTNPPGWLFITARDRYVFQTQHEHEHDHDHDHDHDHEHEHEHPGDHEDGNAQHAQHASHVDRHQSQRNATPSLRPTAMSWSVMQLVKPAEHIGVMEATRLVADFGFFDLSHAVAYSTGYVHGAGLNTTAGPTSADQWGELGMIFDKGVAEGARLGRDPCTGGPTEQAYLRSGVLRYTSMLVDHMQNGFQPAQSADDGEDTVMWGAGVINALESVYRGKWGVLGTQLANSRGYLHASGMPIPIPLGRCAKFDGHTPDEKGMFRAGFHQARVFVDDAAASTSSAAHMANISMHMGVIAVVKEIEKFTVRVMQQPPM